MRYYFKNIIEIIKKNDCIDAFNGYRNAFYSPSSNSTYDAIHIICRKIN